jgi:pentatricopeptide repeat protein
MALLGEMKEGGRVAPETMTYNAVIDACAKSGRVEEALKLLTECGPAANVVTYNSAMRACCNGGQPDVAVDLLQVRALRQSHSTPRQRAGFGRINRRGPVCEWVSSPASVRC